MTFDLNNALCVILIASIASVVLSSGLYLTLPRTRRVGIIQN